MHAQFHPDDYHIFIYIPDFTAFVGLPHFISRHAGSVNEITTVMMNADALKSSPFVLNQNYGKYIRVLLCTCFMYIMLELYFLHASKVTFYTVCGFVSMQKRAR